jgi:hypothetical protein
MAVTQHTWETAARERIYITDSPKIDRLKNPRRRDLALTVSLLSSENAGRAYSPRRVL